jgi:polysaccharide deacetylase family protein (PEP-CTERM system associated)
MQTKNLLPDSRKVTNALTVDAEGFIESNRESFTIPDGFYDQKHEAHELQRNMECVLELFEVTGAKATFFFLGTVAARLPRLVEEVAQAGHEVGSHGAEHRRVFELEKTAFRRALSASKARLEDLAGAPVEGFRAPDFSITRASFWALDVLADLGFRYDSSIYPIGIHDVYGVREADRFVFRWANGLLEFPLSTFEVAGRRVPFAGGGYFRLYPLALTRWLIERTNRSGHPVMFYIHPYEVGPIIPKIPGLSPYRKFRHYYNASCGQRRLRALLTGQKFGPAIHVLQAMGALDGEAPSR